MRNNELNKKKQKMSAFIRMKEQNMFMEMKNNQAYISSIYNELLEREGLFGYFIDRDWTCIPGKKILNFKTIY